MKQKLTDTNYTVSRGGRVEDYWMTRVMHPHYAQEEAKQQEVDMVAILKEYKLKGFEFGNWVNQNDRYDFIHAFTRSAQILSEIIGSKNIGLDLLVGVAFGARGHGGGAVAHYEPMHNMINLTKEKSYGSLAHEWGHAIDYNLGRHIDQNKDYSFLTGGHSVAAILPTNTGAQLRMWANAVVDEAKATPSYKRIEKADEYWHRRTEVWARFMEQYVAYQCKLKKKSPRYLALTFEEYTKMTPYWTEADFVKIARGSMFSFMAVLKGVLNNRYNLTASPYKYKTRDMLYPKPGKAPKPKYTLPLYVVLKGLKPTDSNMLKFDKTEIKDGKVYYIGRSVDATPKEAYRHTPEEKILADYDRVPRLTAEKAIREKWNSGTHQKAAKRAASKPATGKKGVDKLEVRRQLIKLGVIEGSGQSVHFTPKLKELIKLYPGHKQEVLEVACNMWAGDTIRRRGGGIVEHYKEEAIKEARRVLASRKTTATSKTTTGKNPVINLRKFYQVTGTLFSGYNSGTHVSIILTEVLFSDYFYIEKILGSDKERSYYGISATGKVFGSSKGCSKSDVERKIRYGKSILKDYCHKRGEWDLKVIPKIPSYGPEYFRTLDDADRYAKRIEKLCGYKTKRTEFLITQKHVDEVMKKFSDNK